MVDFSSIVASLAWPVAAIVIVVMLRQHLQKLFDRLEKAETPLGTLTF